MTVIEYRNIDEQTWLVLRYPPTQDWNQLKLLADRWSIAIRKVNTKTGVAEREYIPRIRS